MALGKVWSMLGCGGVVLLLLAGTASAQAGGLPQCQARLQTCTAALGTCTADLTACEAESHAVFPGDGAGQGAALSYTNNGDGTATDNNTLLMWEVKDNNGGMHDVDNLYTWTVNLSLGTEPNGTLFTVFLNTLNNTCDGDETTACTSNADCTGIGNGLCGHASFRDWRIPHVKELQSIVDYGQNNPAIDPTFPGLTAVGEPFWSSTTLHQGSPTFAWHVSFSLGSVNASFKNVPLYARAVRGGQ
jgi:Protein of unknown function (DUF1566)